MNKIKILFVIEASTVSGPAKNLLGFLSLLRSREFQDEALLQVEPAIVTFHRSRNANSMPAGSAGTASPNDFVASARALGFDVDVISERFVFDPGVIGQFREIVARREPTLIQTHMVKSHFLTKLSGMSRRYRWIAYHHGYTTTDLKMRGYNQLNRWSLPSALQVITVCDAFARDLIHAGLNRNRISVCHNAVPLPAVSSLEQKKSLRKKLGIPAAAPVALSVGRLSREKGHLDLIESLAELNANYSPVRPTLVIVGEGPERERIETAVRLKNLSGQVVFAGHTTNVHDYYAIADMLVLPSHSEGSPNVLLEGMSAGLPVVATAVGGVPEIASTGKTALLVARGDWQGFARAMNRFLTDGEMAKRLGRAAAAHVNNKFSPDTQAHSLLQIYQRVISGPQRSNGMSVT